MRAIRCVLLAFAVAALAASPASAANLSTLYSFCRHPPSCTDGTRPFQVVFDASGSLLGTAAQAGANNRGALYELIPPTSGRKWHEKVLHDFCSKPNCHDGADPFTAPTPDGRGNFFGAAASGDGNIGVVYELSPGDGHTGWNYRAIYNFCSQPNCADGEEPSGALALDTSGNIYGITDEGGANHLGVVFELSPIAGRARKHWTEKVLYSFCSAANCADGGIPSGGLTYAGAASGGLYDGTSPLYGTASGGGSGDHGTAGTVFTLTPKGDGTWVQDVIYNICSANDCRDGITPVGKGALTLDAAGNLYGATMAGGTKGYGVVYELSFSGGKWRQTTLHNFCSLPSCSDGQGTSNLIMDATGNLYGTSSVALFRLVPNGHHSTFDVLEQFCSACKNGNVPGGPVIMDASGALYGTTYAGGAHDLGTVFKVTP